MLLERTLTFIWELMGEKLKVVLSKFFTLSRVVFGGKSHLRSVQNSIG
jgi:hypothetical protein